MKKFPCKSESFVCRQEKATAAAVRSLRAKMVSLAAVNELKIIIFVLSYLTVLVYTKTIILFTSVSVASGGDLAHRFAARYSHHHLHFGELIIVNRFIQG